MVNSLLSHLCGHCAAGTDQVSLQSHLSGGSRPVGLLMGRPGGRGYRLQNHNYLYTAAVLLHWCTASCTAVLELAVQLLAADHSVNTFACLQCFYTEFAES